MVSVLFVCLANTCRSPAAEGILRHMADKAGVDLHVESCGIGDWNLGQLPNPRMRDAAKNRGVCLSSRAQKFIPEFFDTFDFILVVDTKVMNELYCHAKEPGHKAKIHLITHFSEAYRDEAIPDPYYGGEAVFETVLDMLEDSCTGIVHHIKPENRPLA